MDPITLLLLTALAPSAPAHASERPRRQPQVSAAEVATQPAIRVGQRFTDHKGQLYAVSEKGGVLQLTKLTDKRGSK